MESIEGVKAKSSCTGVRLLRKQESEPPRWYVDIQTSKENSTVYALYLNTTRIHRTFRIGRIETTEDKFSLRKC